MKDRIRIEVEPLHLPLRVSFKQASFTRNTSESIWASVSRGGVIGYGEGCPRSYVTSENVVTAISWLHSVLPEIENECTSYEALVQLTYLKRSAIDQHPAAWCAIETGLLDLFAKENNTSVEKLIGMDDPLGIYAYTAVLGDSEITTYQAQLSRYFKWGFKDFKIKLNGELRRDRKRIKLWNEMCEAAEVGEFSLRVDANNLWGDDTSAAIKHLEKLRHSIIAVEEPLAPKKAVDLSRISTELGLPVILDESLSVLRDLDSYESLPGEFIGNMKISKLGGIIRSREMVNSLKKRSWNMIIGAHVGETSIMTRAGMCIARDVGELLFGHEGAFGTLLLEREPISPSLMFGAKGHLDLSQPYVVESEGEAITHPISRWQFGWGLDHVSSD